MGVYLTAADMAELAEGANMGETKPSTGGTVTGADALQFAQKLTETGAGFATALITGQLPPEPTREPADTNDAKKVPWWAWGLGGVAVVGGVTWLARRPRTRSNRIKR